MLRQILEKAEKERKGILLAAERRKTRGKSGKERKKILPARQPTEERRNKNEERNTTKDKIKSIENNIFQLDTLTIIIQP